MRLLFVALGNVVMKLKVRVKQIFQYMPMLFLNFFYFFSFLIPKKKGLWLFSSWLGKQYLDNPKYIYQELLKNSNRVQPYWLVKDKTLLHRLEALKYPVIYSFSVRGFWLQLRAEVVVFTHGVRDDFIPCLIGAQTKRVQTFHGIPIKKIGFDNLKAGTSRGKIVRFFLPFLREDYDLVIAGSEEVKKLYNSAFGTPLEKIKITGYPRNDEIFRSSKNNYTKEDDGFKIIYMPTLRGGINDNFNLLAPHYFDFDTIDSQLNSLNATLFIKLHPVQAFTQEDEELISRAKRIEAVDNHDDIYESLGKYDVLITDYSSIFFDFMIVGKPIIMAPIDYDDYVKHDREVYFDYQSLCPAPPCRDWEEIMRSIELLRHERHIPNRYYEIQKKFHKYNDDKSSERVIEEIKRLVL